ncbi:MAG: ABC transporter ATP-binding protein [Gammaproteobacteria bacterium]
MSTTPLLRIDALSVEFGRAPGPYTRVVDQVSLSVGKGEKVALVGESGSGKSVLALSVLQLHDPVLSRYASGRIEFEGHNLLDYTEPQLRRIRGRDIAMIFQEPMTAFNPVYRIGEQLIEPLLIHEGLDRPTARRRVIELLDRTGIVEPHKRIDAFPHMLSGGQRQRAMIAMALACKPKLLIADEPTTALDVTIQVQILELLEDLQQDFGMSVLMITHDLNMVRRFAERICVMQNGRLVEENDVAGLFAEPRHPYTIHLLNSQPESLGVEHDVVADGDGLLLAAEDIRCYFPIKAGFLNRRVGDVKAVDDISLSLARGETLGIVGESGSGKTTLGMCLLRLQECEGRIVLNGEDLQEKSQRALRPLRKNFQVVFQDPFSSLSPRMTIEDIVGEGLRVHFPQLTAAQCYERIVKVMQEVGLDETMLSRYPHEFSGGQRQRIAIARVIILEPKLILLDEPTSALDVSVQKQVLSLLRELQNKHNISYLFITHDLRVIRAIAHRVMVMKDGRLIEAGPTETLFNRPANDYTRTLLNASLYSAE